MCLVDCVNHRRNCSEFSKFTDRWLTFTPFPSPMQKKEIVWLSSFEVLTAWQIFFSFLRRDVLQISFRSDRCEWWFIRGKDAYDENSNSKEGTETCPDLTVLKSISLFFTISLNLSYTILLNHTTISYFITHIDTPISQVSLSILFLTTH